MSMWVAVSGLLRGGGGQLVACYQLGSHGTDNKQVFAPIDTAVESAEAHGLSSYRTGACG